MYHQATDDQICVKTFCSLAFSLIGNAGIVCGAGSMNRYGVRPSVCLSHMPAAAACGGFAAVDSAVGDIDRLLQQRRAAAEYGQCHVVSVCK